MSYEIVYERQFIRINQEGNVEPWIIPLTLHGSNNTYESTYNGRDRRARDWGAIFFNGPNRIPMEKPSVILQEIENYFGGNQDHFKRNGKYIDDAGLRRFFENGIKTARTLEELNEMSMYSIRLRCYLSIWKEHNNTRELTTRVSTSSELIQFIHKAIERVNRKEKDELIYVQVGFEGDKAITHLKPEYIVKRKTREFKDEYFVIKSERLGNSVYIRKLTAKSVYYCYEPESARKFGTEKEAFNWIENKLIGRFNKSVIETLVIERVEL